MYKVFINEKKLTLSKSETLAEKNIPFENITGFEVAIDLLENTSCKEVNLYGNDLNKIWEYIRQKAPIIEAGGGIVKNTKDEILFIYRNGKWDLPKGKVEPNEWLKNAALREVEEETGLQELILEDFIAPTFHLYKEKNRRLLKATYWFTMTYDGIQIPQPQTEEGITKVAWISKEKIVNTVLPNTYQNIKLILETAGLLS